MRLVLDTSKGNLHLSAWQIDGGVPSRSPIASLWRTGHHITLGLRSGYGISLHRHAGISLTGLPRSGGTSLLWGEANERVGLLGKDNRAFHFGPVGIYIGRDF
jgi:hypothetical protein